MRLLGVRVLSASFFVSAVFSASSASAADYGLPGPHETLTKDIAGFDGLSGQVAYPDTKGGTYPVIVLAHGFASGADKMIGWGQHLASHGFVAVALRNCGSGFVCAPDANAEAGLVQKALTYVEGGIAPEGVSDQADASRFLLLGHSAGGQAVIVAAAKLAPAGVVLFDPVGGGQNAASVEPAKSALGSVCSPVLTVFAEPHETGSGLFAPPSCNKKGAWMSFAGASTGPQVSVVVKGSTHCDGELPARPECAIACGGGADAARQKTYRHYATAFALAVLENDADAANALVPSALEADARVKDGKTSSGTACEPKGGAGGSGGTNAGGAAGEEAGGAAGTGAAGTTGEGGNDSGSAGAPQATGGEGGSAGDGNTPTTGGQGGSETAGKGGAANAGKGGAAGEPDAIGGAAGSNNTTSLGVDEDSGCGCRVPRSPARTAPALGVLALATTLLLRRRSARAQERRGR